MAQMKVKVGGSTRSTLNVDFEVAVVNGTLHPYFSGTIDGFTILSLRLDSIGASIHFDKLGNAISEGDTITMTEINNGEIQVSYDHINPSSFLEFTAVGDAKYKGTLEFISIV